MEILLDNGPRPGRRTGADKARSGSVSRLVVLVIGVIGVVYAVANVVMTVSGGF